MKLSEMNTRQLAKAMCALVPPVQRIAQDEGLNGLFAAIKEKKQAGATVMEMLGLMLDAVPLLLDTHYEESVAIISAMTGKSAEEINSQRGMQTIADLRGCIDDQLLDFFRSSAAMGKTGKVRPE